MITVDTQTDRQTNRQTEREREIEKKWVSVWCIDLYIMYNYIYTKTNGFFGEKSVYNTRTSYKYALVSTCAKPARVIRITHIQIVSNSNSE